MSQEELQAKKEEYLKIAKIAERAEKMEALAFDRLSLIMDLQNVHEKVGLRLDELLNADEFNFLHDIVGIQNNMNRETCELENCFSPRYSKH